jgi:hypothetical protein
MQKLIAGTLAALALTFLGISSPASASAPCNSIMRPCHGPVHPR